MNQTLLTLCSLLLTPSQSVAEDDLLVLRAPELSAYHQRLAGALRDASRHARPDHVTGAIGADSPLPESSDRPHFLNVVHRSGASWAESHDQLTDFYVVLEGSGTLLLGGTMIDAIELEDRPGERRSPRLQGAVGRAVGKGDLVNIPPNVPHQWDLGEDESVTYVIVKVRGDGSGR